MAGAICEEWRATVPAARRPLAFGRDARPLRARRPLSYSNSRNRAYPARLTGSRVPSRRMATRLSFAYSSILSIRSLSRYERWMRTKRSGSSSPTGAGVRAWEAPARSEARRARERGGAGGCEANARRAEGRAARRGAEAQRITCGNTTHVQPRGWEPRRGRCPRAPVAHLFARVANGRVAARRGAGGWRGAKRKPKARPLLKLLKSLTSAQEHYSHHCNRDEREREQMAAIRNDLFHSRRGERLRRNEYREADCYACRDAQVISPRSWCRPIVGGSPEPKSLPITRSCDVHRLAIIAGEWPPLICAVRFRPPASAARCGWSCCRRKRTGIARASRSCTCCGKWISGWSNT